METTGIMKFQNRTDKSIRLLAFLEAKEGHGKELKEILLEVVEPTRREPGNIAYVLHRSNDNPDELLLMRYGLTRCLWKSISRSLTWKL